MKLSAADYAALKQALLDGQLVTDSDIYDFAEGHGLEESDVSDAVWEILSADTPCAGCKHIAFRYSMFPCNSCFRQPSIIDRYEAADSSKGDKKHDD